MAGWVVVVVSCLVVAQEWCWGGGWIVVVAGSLFCAHVPDCSSLLVVGKWLSKPLISL